MIITVPNKAITLNGKNLALEIVKNVLVSSLLLTGAAPTRGIGLIIHTFAPTLQAENSALPSADTLTFATTVPVAFGEGFRGPAVTTVALAGQTPVRLVRFLTSPAADTLALSSDAPTVIGPDHRVAAPPRKHMFLFGEAPLVFHLVPPNALFGPPVGSAAFAGQAVDVERSDSPSEDPVDGSLALIGEAPTLMRGTGRAPAVNALVLAGQVPASAEPGELTSPLVGSFTLTGVLPYIASNELSLVLTGYAPATFLAQTTSPGEATMSLEGWLPTFDVLGVTAVAAAAPTLTGHAPTAVFSSFLIEGRGDVISLTVDRALVAVAAPKETLVT